MIDLNADLGEGTGNDEELLAIVTSANIACGGHAGTAMTMRTAVQQAHDRGVALGAHPSYPDHEGFGRRKLRIGQKELTESLRRQVGELCSIASTVGARVRYIKPHGALYHAVIDDEEHASALVALAGEYSLPLLLAPQAATSIVGSLARKQGLTLHGEGFVDRGYLDSGLLLERGKPGAVLSRAEDALTQALALVGGNVATVTGGRVRLAVSSLCVHGDTPDAVAIAAKVKEGLGKAGIPLGAWSTP